MSRTGRDAEAQRDREAIATCALLLERYFDVLEANSIAAQRLDSAGNRDLALRLRSEYEQSVRYLTELSFELGGDPPKHGDLGRVVGDAKVALGEIAGDRGVLGALKSNEGGLIKLLEKTSQKRDLPVSLASRVREELDCSRARVALLDERLEELKDRAHTLS
ncbi:MAG TPA: hypothetical protein VK524_10500 [Polyangiaceae bacterium]|nr:hypothetical protein [Polyangiaceae bacterium]